MHLVARAAKYLLATQTFKEVKAELRNQLSGRLTLHVSFVHKLCKPCQHPAPLRAVSLAPLSSHADKWGKSGEKTCGRFLICLACLATVDLPLPPANTDEVFQDTSVAAYRNVCLSFPAKKVLASDIWEARLMGSLPDQALFLALCCRLTQWMGR